MEVIYHKISYANYVSKQRNSVNWAGRRSDKHMSQEILKNVFDKFNRLNKNKRLYFITFFIKCLSCLSDWLHLPKLRMLLCYEAPDVAVLRTFTGKFDNARRKKHVSTVPAKLVSAWNDLKVTFWYYYFVARSWWDCLFIRMLK